MRKILTFIGLILFSGSVLAGSTINPTIPAANSSLSSAPLRGNFAAAYSDINNILSQFAAATSPASPSLYQYWLDTSTTPSTLKIYDGSTWVSVGRLNPATHVWSPVGSYIGSPVATTYGGTGADLHAATGAVSMSSGVTSVGTLPASYLAAPLTALSTFNTNGLITQTAANTFTGRTLTGTSSEITVTNGNGVSGNPTLSLPSALTFTGKTITGGTYSAPIISTISNTGTLTLPTSTDTLIGKATTDTLTNKTFDTAGAGNSFSINSVAATGNTGTGLIVRDTSPTLVTPALGTPASGVATNLTGTASGLTAGHVTTNANLTGVITSVGNATSIASQTGTGTKFVVDTSPTLVTPIIGVATGTSLAATGLVSAGGVLSTSLTTDATSTTAAAMTTAGGLGVAKKVYIGDTLRVGTAAVAGDITNSVAVISGIHTTIESSTAALNNTATTLFTLPTTGFGTFIVTIGFSGVNDPTTYSATAIIRTDGANATITSLSTSTGMFLTLSGMNVQGRHTIGSTVNISWSVLRIS